MELRMQLHTGATISVEEKSSGMVWEKNNTCSACFAWLFVPLEPGAAAHSPHYYTSGQVISATDFVPTAIKARRHPTLLAISERGWPLSGQQGGGATPAGLPFCDIDSQLESTNPLLEVISTNGNMAVRWLACVTILPSVRRPTGLRVLVKKKRKFIRAGGCITESNT